MRRFTKICIKCGAEKPLNEFPPMSKMQSGRSVKCRDCIDHDWATYESHCIEKRKR